MKDSVKFRVCDDAYGHVTRNRDPEDEWDNDDTSTVHNIQGIQLVDVNKDNNSYYDGTTLIDLVPGETYYLLYVIYSTGDTFSHHTGEIEFIDLYESWHFAEEMQSILCEATENKDKRGEDKWTAPLLVEQTGADHLVHMSWQGYFESLETIEIQSVTLLP